MKAAEYIKSEIIKNNPGFTEEQLEKDYEGKIYQMVWKLFYLCDKHLLGDAFNKMRDEFEITIKEYGYDLYEMYYRMSKEDWIKEVNSNIQRCQTEQGKIELLNELLRMHDGRKKANECGLGEWFEKEIRNLKQKGSDKTSFDERSVLGFDILTYQGPFTLGEARAQVLRILVQTMDYGGVKQHLEMYYPNWTKEQIEVEYERIINAYKK